MKIIIDGYNVLKSSQREISHDERRSFIRMIGAYAKRKKHQVLVVFDGGDLAMPYKEVIDGMSVIYSGWKQTADEYIMEYIEGHQGHEMLLVSSDYELNLYASQLGVPSLGSQDFLIIICNEPEPKRIAREEVSVTLETEAGDLDTLMREASKQVPTKAEDIGSSSLKSASKKISRKDKKLYNILKKL